MPPLLTAFTVGFNILGREVLAPIALEASLVLVLATTIEKLRHPYSSLDILRDNETQSTWLQLLPCFAGNSPI
ncbi:hypothetical protein CLAIMM_05208 [Cladophialophora immunda]|nr:hypothetical protein CLAIMM_05208 [Cladophialophora immunda]